MSVDFTQFSKTICISFGNNKLYMIFYYTSSGHLVLQNKCVCLPLLEVTGALELILQEGRVHEVDVVTLPHKAQPVRIIFGHFFPANL